jgi:hypothetical protein
MVTSGEDANTASSAPTDQSIEDKSTTVDVSHPLSLDDGIANCSSISSQLLTGFEYSE